MTPTHVPGIRPRPVETNRERIPRKRYAVGTGDASACLAKNGRSTQ